jgi:hypothetical protein
MEDLKQLKVGDKVWIIGHRAHVRSPDIEYVRGTVTRVGRKYITVERDEGGWGAEDQYSLEDGLNKDVQYSQNRTWRVYISRESYEQGQERRRVETAFRQHFQGYGKASIDKAVTTEDIRAAAKLLRIDIDKEQT